MGSPNSSLSTADYIIGKKVVPESEWNQGILIEVIRGIIANMKPILKHLPARPMDGFPEFKGCCAFNPPFGGFNVDEPVVRIPSTEDHTFRFNRDEKNEFSLSLTPDGRIIMGQVSGCMVYLTELKDDDLKKIEGNLGHQSLVFLLRKLLVQHNEQLLGYVASMNRQITLIEQATERMGWKLPKT